MSTINLRILTRDAAQEATADLILKLIKDYVKKEHYQLEARFMDEDSLKISNYKNYEKVGKDVIKNNRNDIIKIFKESKVLLGFDDEYYQTGYKNDIFKILGKSYFKYSIEDPEAGTINAFVNKKHAIEYLDDLYKQYNYDISDDELILNGFTYTPKFRK